MNALDTVLSGELSGATSPSIMPDIPCNLVRFKALATNVGNVYIGGASVTVANGVTDQKTGLELAPGDDTGWIPVSNLKKFYRVCDNAGDDLSYLALL